LVKNLDGGHGHLGGETAHEGERDCTRTLESEGGRNVPALGIRIWKNRKKKKPCLTGGGRGSQMLRKVGKYANNKCNRKKNRQGKCSGK